MTAKISLIMTVYNRERYLKMAIDSVLAQTREDWELIIWDDGSTDRSVEIASEYSQDDSRIQFIAAKHLGRSKALKAATEKTTGTYLGWIDSDDALAPTALEETASVLDSNSNIGLVYTDYMVIDALGKIKGKGKRCQIPYSKDRLLIDFMIFHFRLFRRSSFEEAGGIYESFKYAEDYDLCLRLSEVTEVYHLNKPLYYYRNHPENISNEQRLEQIFCSRNAIAQALQRRGLSEQFEIDVQIVGRFSLRKKN
ncbi:MAG: glycosyltransferase [Xenococcaceae cyanobacterium MO_188.B29]|nr:glycosyltransferase [Xenococcaceae cyanobacterium MO_188.B29]